MRDNRSQPMPVKYWSRAGLCLTDWCEAACASCYMGCGPRRTAWMDVARAVELWRGLADASPHGCRVHITGGEPFGDWGRLQETLSRAVEQGMQADAVETNAAWADDDNLIRRRVRALDALGIGRLAISSDPFHQQFVPIDRCRRLAEAAGQILGQSRVQVRWGDWLERGIDLFTLPVERQNEMLRNWARENRDRLNGRAAEQMAPLLPARSIDAFRGNDCCHPLLRSKHVHVWPDGTIMPGVCAGISLGNAFAQPPHALWTALDADYRDRPIVGTLSESGPVGLLPLLNNADPIVAGRYASKCHLCYTLRKELAREERFSEELRPRSVYRFAEDG